MFTKCYLNSEYIHSRLMNLGQKVLGRNYTLAPVAPVESVGASVRPGFKPFVDQSSRHFATT